MKISIDQAGLLILKNLGRLFKYPHSEEITEFDFLDSFPQKDALKKVEKKLKLPTIPDYEMYRSLHAFCLTLLVNFRFLEYAKRDILLLRHVHSALPDESTYSRSLLLDMDLVKYYANLQLYGVKVDPDAIKKGREDISTKINNEILNLAKADPSLFRPRSPQHVRQWLKDTLIKEGGCSAVDVDKLVPNSDKTTQKKLVRQFPKILSLQHLRDYKKHEGVLKFLPADTDTQFPKFEVYGTVTGRMVAKNPNTQQMPKDEPIRCIFIAPKSYRLVVGDFDQLELRIMAFKHNVGALVSAFEKNKDPHSQTAAKAFLSDISALTNVTYEISAYKVIQDSRKKESAQRTDAEKKIIKFRDIGKVLNFSVPYGTTAYGLTESLECSFADAKAYIERYFSTNPELEEAIKRAHQAVERLRLATHHSYSGSYSKWEYEKSPIEPVYNDFGLPRHFTIAQSLIAVLHYLNSKEKRDIDLRGRSKACCDAYGNSIRGAFKSLQANIKREAFNFTIQSVGAYFTKYLQMKILAHFLPDGIIKLSEVSLLPTLNVHDELHFYVKSDDAKALLDRITEETLREISSLAGGSITLAFDSVSNWADK